MSAQTVHTYVLSLSGGKDSTAMLLALVERSFPFDEVVFFDTGWEFPAMHEHLDRLDSEVIIPYLGRPMVRLQPRIPFDFQFAYKVVRYKSDKEGIKKGDINYFGKGWPKHDVRWCTREKCDTIDAYRRRQWPGATALIGYAADEQHRMSKTDGRLKAMYPLVEYGWSEADCLAYCYQRGYRWSGLYEQRARVSCWCCPLQSISGLRALREHHPDLWARLLEMGRICPPERASFMRKGMTVEDWDRRFSDEKALLEYCDKAGKQGVKIDVLRELTEDGK